jgi:DNA-binding NtrC family response regulator
MKRKSKQRLLIIEDEIATLTALKLLFEGEFEVEAYESVPPALLAMKQRTFAVAIVDLMLNGIQGDEMLVKIKELWPFTEVIIVTAQKNKESVAEDYFNAGAYDFMIKPWKNDALLRIVRRAAERFELLRRIQAMEGQLLEACGPIARIADTSAGSFQNLVAKLVDSSPVKFNVLNNMLEKAALRHALASTQWNQVQSASLLGVHRNTVVKMMKRQKIATVKRPKGIKPKNSKNKIS